MSLMTGTTTAAERLRLRSYRVGATPVRARRQFSRAEDGTIFEYVELASPDGQPSRRTMILRDGRVWSERVTEWQEVGGYYVPATELYSVAAGDGQVRRLSVSYSDVKLDEGTAATSPPLAGMDAAGPCFLDVVLVLAAAADAGFECTAANIGLTCARALVTLYGIYYHWTEHCPITTP
jgi:hypothetical protein